MRSLRDLNQEELEEMINKALQENSKQIMKICVDPKKGKDADFFTGVIDDEIFFKLGQRGATFFVAFSAFSNCLEINESSVATKKIIDCFSVLLGGQPTYAFKEDGNFPFSFNKVLFWGDMPQFSELKMEKTLKKAGFNGYLHPASTNWQFAGRLSKIYFFTNYNPRTEKTEVLSTYNGVGDLMEIFEKIFGKPDSEHLQLNKATPFFVARWRGVY